MGEVISCPKVNGRHKLIRGSVPGLRPKLGEDGVDLVQHELATYNAVFRVFRVAGYTRMKAITHFLGESALYVADGYGT